MSGMQVSEVAQKNEKMAISIGDWFNILFRGGTSSLSPAESSLLAVVAESLPDDEKRILHCQIDAINLVQRPQPKRMTICFHRPNSHSPPFDRQDYETCLACITWKQAEGKKAKVRVMLHSGRLQSIEGHIPEAPIRSVDCTVEIWPSKSSPLPDAIDRVERGGKKNAQ